MNLSDIVIHAVVIGICLFLGKILPRSFSIPILTIMFAVYFMIAIFFMIAIIIGKEAASFAGAAVLVFGFLPSIYVGLFLSKKCTASRFKRHDEN